MSFSFIENKKDTHIFKNKPYVFRFHFKWNGFGTSLLCQLKCRESLIYTCTYKQHLLSAFGTLYEDIIRRLHACRSSQTLECHLHDCEWVSMFLTSKHDRCRSRTYFSFSVRLDLFYIIKNKERYKFGRESINISLTIVKKCKRSYT